MLVYCTLFDQKYLSRGVAMIESLSAQTNDFRMYVFAFDEKSLMVMKTLSLPNVIVISLSEFEDEALLSVKASRSPVEYCWTSTPSTIDYVLQKFHEPHCTYLDADLYFFGDPHQLFDELGSQSVLITDHRYTPRYDLSALSGKYCVQYITFKNTDDGMKALQWWKKSCIDWCYAIEEEGKFGDQKYLDDWPERFQGIHVLEHLGGGLAPWNIQQYVLTKSAKKIMGRERTSGTTFPLLFYHFHYLRYYESDKIDLGDYILTDDVQKTLYHPYLEHMNSIVKRLSTIDGSVDWYGKRTFETNFAHLLVRLKRMIKRQYNVYPVSTLMKKFAQTL